MQSNLQERLRRRREDKMADKEREVYEQLEDSKREMAEKQRAETEKLMADEVKQRIYSTCTCWQSFGSTPNICLQVSHINLCKYIV